MLRATFLGHQGWLLSTGDTHVLIDPLLGEGFGHGGLAGTVFPPRTFDSGSMPPIDAVWLTHEHDDHFDLPSLKQLERTVPIHASSRSSSALFGVLRELGFTVVSVEPESVIEIRDLTMRTFVADHRATPEADEWDVLPFLATDAAGHGAFASSVDVAMPDALLDATALSGARAWMLCMANNTTDVRFVGRGVGRVEPSDDTDALAAVLTRRWERAARRAGAPAFTAVTGGGWSHPEDVAWIDRLAFCIDPDRLASSLREASGASVEAARPGDVVELGADGMQQRSSSWVIPSTATRPPPATVDVPDLVDPACGRRRLDGDGWLRLEAGLRDLARFMFGHPIFMAAHAYPGSCPFALRLHDDGGPRTYAWRPNAAGFERSTADATSGLELWSTDLLALLEGALAPSAICYTARVRAWNRAPQLLRASPHLLWSFAHPLHRPHITRHLYDQLTGLT